MHGQTEAQNKCLQHCTSGSRDIKIEVRSGSVAYLCSDLQKLTTKLLTYSFTNFLKLDHQFNYFKTL